MFNISKLGFIFTFCVQFTGIIAQLLYGCPLDWESQENKCYKFVNDEKLFLEEARAACWHDGATLLQVDTYNEHQFVTEWITKHDVSTVYFTSGFYNYDTRNVIWGPSGYVANGDLSFWADGTPPVIAKPPTNTNPSSGQSVVIPVYTRLVYGLGARGLVGWMVAPSAVPSGYICEIAKTEVQSRLIEDRDFLYGSKSLDVKKIGVGPHIESQPRNMLVYPYSPSAYIECFSDGNPVPEYSWLRESSPLTSNDDSRYTLTAGRFTIEDPNDQDDQGSYQCVASNKYGTVISNPVKVEFGRLHGFSPVKPEDVTANKFEGTRISCNTPSAFPDVRYNWFFTSVSEPIFAGHYNMFVSRSGYLYFSSVQPTDQRTYYCTVTLAALSGYDTSTNQPPSANSLGVMLRVAGTESGYFQPFIYSHVFPSPAVRGATIRIECIAYGSLPLKYSWTREGDRGFEPNTKISDFNRVLIIENATLEAEGNYVCHVNGRGGFTKKTITLTVESRPYFPYGINDRLADPGKQVKWRCMAVGRPAPTYSWYKDGQLLQTIPGQIEIRNNYLYIPQVDKDRDEGMYQCGARNVHGTTFSYGQLKILEFAPNFDRFPIEDRITIPQGGNYTIPCKVEGAPLPEVSWLKNGGQLPVMPGDTSGHIGMTYDFALVFNGIEISDAGYYTCKAVNSLGEASNSTRVSVVAGIKLMTPPQSGSVLVNRTTFLYCQASHSANQFDVTYTWKLNGHDIDTRRSDHYVMSYKNGQNGLWIRNTQLKHHGLYTCEARTTIHTVRASAYLKVYGPPGPPAGVYVNAASMTSHSCRLVWTTVASIENGNPISRYDIEAELHIRPGEWQVVQSDVLEHITVAEARQAGLRDDQRSVIVEGLLPDVSYSFRVRAINDHGKGPEASKGSVSVKVPATAPVVAPRNIRGLDEGKVGTLNIMWDALDISEHCGPGLGYNVYYRRAGDPKEYKHARVNGSDTTIFTDEVGIENYYLEYEVKVGAFNDFGDGPTSPETIVMSAEGMPLATVLMGDCDNYNGSAFSMSWTSVEDSREVLKGRLKGYRIRFWHIDDPEFIIWYDLYGQHDGTVVIGLHDNTNYWSSVQVMNYAGVGPVGEIRLAETFHLPPRHFPRHVKVFPHSEHSVKVTWQGVMTEFDEEVLQGYILRVWKIQEDIRTARDIKVDKVDEAIVDGLQMQTVYVLRVLGYSIGGDGSLSPHVYFTVEGEAVPFDPTTTRFCFNHDMCPDSATSLYVSITTMLLSLIFGLLFKV